ncbi:MAG TPA: RNA degradosome polyphosphate kinase, partial [Polyangiaceae bacterium]|nr:RNA degradosome polyphosphate kinase [Polyangiaceae bacterium]
VAPPGLHEAILGLIRREAAHAEAGRPARIIAKMNSIVDADVIAALYAASQAGVQVDLLVRGICCLRPGIKGVSETIRVHAVIDRFLEHSRIFDFENGGDPEVFFSSADWMPRNFRRRVETMFPIVDPVLKERVRSEILAIMAADTKKGWLLDSSGRYQRAVGGDSPLRSQSVFMEQARERAREPEHMLARQMMAAPRPDAALEKLRRKTKKKKKRDKRGRRND